MRLAVATLPVVSRCGTEWVRFQLSDADYRQLAGDPDVHAIAVVDRKTSRIMGVKFLGRQSG
jgi:hypothetical protein